MAKPNSIPSQEVLHSLFTYKDGELYWKIKPAQRVSVGDIAGCKYNVYKKVYINNKSYYSHRVIFMFHHGYVSDQIDHIDGNKTNNKIENLRPATNTQNQLNKKLSKQNTTGVKGVNIHTQTGKYHVKLRVNGVQHSFGLYKDLELAGLVAEMAREEYHGEYARHF